MPESRLPPRRDRGPELWKPEEGEVLTGFVTDRETKDSQYRGETVEVLTIDTGQGYVSAWCSTTDLRAMIAEEDPQPGDFLEVRYDGMVRTRQGRTRKLYSYAVTKQS